MEGKNSVATTQLLRLSTGHFSLEINPSDRQKVAEAIESLFGKPQVSLLAPYGSNYSFGDADFAFQDEWDDPCLISSSARGDDVLQRLALTLNLS